MTERTTQNESRTATQNQFLYEIADSLICFTW